jgi:hypothetical protein
VGRLNLQMDRQGECSVTDFLELMFALEQQGWDFLAAPAPPAGIWRIDAYDVTAILHPGTHEVEVKGTATGTILVEETAELRFLLGLNLGAPSRAACEIQALSVNTAAVTHSSEHHQITVSLAQPVSGGEQITLGFHATLEPLARKCWVNAREDGIVPGLGKGETELCIEGYWLPFANVQFQPMAATVTLVAPAGQTAIFSGEHLETTEAGGVARHRFRTIGPGWPTAIAGDFERVERAIGNGSRILFAHQPGYERTADRVADLAIDVLRRLIGWLGENPVRKFYLVQLKRTWFGQYAPFPLVAFPRDDIVPDPDTMDTAAWQALAGMLGHEIAHFWFGGLVQSGLDEQWLSEGFAQYLNVMVVEALHGRVARDAQLAGYIEALQRIAGEPQAPLCRIPLHAPNQGLLVRVKGALVLHELRQAVGEDGFRHFLRELVARESGQVVTTGAVEALCLDLFPQWDAGGFFARYLYSGEPIDTWSI